MNRKAARALAGLISGGLSRLPGATRAPQTDQPVSEPRRVTFAGPNNQPSSSLRITRNTIRMKLLPVTLLGVALMALSHVHAQTSPATPAATIPNVPVTVAEREEATGTISDVTGERSLVLHTETNAGEPLVFRFAPKVTYVDDDGRIVEAAGLRKNLRVRLSYVKTGGENIIDRVTMLD